MHKRIFLKYYAVTVIAVVATVLLLCAISGVIIGMRTFDTSSDTMERAAVKISKTVANLPTNYMLIAGKMFDTSLSAVKEITKGEVLIYDAGGNFRRSAMQEIDTDCLPPDSVVKSVLSGQTVRKYRAYGEAGNTAGYTVGVPIVTDDNTISGAVFVTAHNVNMSSTVITMLFTFAISGAVVIMIAFVAVYFITKRMMRPLYEMSDAAHNYARGDFSKRLDVRHAGEYAPLAVAFNSMADGIDNLEQVRRSFVADVSHELRTPLTTISGFVDGMLDGTIPPEQHEKYLRIVSEESRRVSSMVSSFLDIARIQSGQMTYVKKPFDVVETAGKVLFAFEDRIEQNSVTLNVDFPEDRVTVNGDADAIYRVIYNLVDNAVKFTPVGGSIDVAVVIAPPKAVISVRNTGCGISREDAAHVFERFYKADRSRSVNKKGTGIGLYLVKNIIDEHGEDIILTSKEGEYAKFSFTLPLDKEES